MRRVVPVWSMLCTLLLCRALAGPAEVAVATEKQLLAAIGTPEVLLIRLTADIKFCDATSVLANTKIYTLQRNLTIASPWVDAEPTMWYPTINFNFVGAKLHVPAGVRLTLQHIMLKQGSLAQGFDLDLIDQTSQGWIVLMDCVRVRESCTPLVRLAGMMNANIFPRPVDTPGNQSTQVVPGGWCAPLKAGGLQGGQCWSQVLRLVDLALRSRSVHDILFYPIINDYFGWSLNTSLLCEEIITDDCLATLGLWNCSKLILEEKLALLGPEPPHVRPPRPHPPATAKPPVPAAVIGGAVAGAVSGVLLLLAVIFLIVRWRRRPLPDSDVEDPPLEKPEFDCENSASCLNGISFMGCLKSCGSCSWGRRSSIESTVGLPKSMLKVNNSMYSSEDTTTNCDAVWSAASSLALPNAILELDEISRNMQTSIQDNQLEIHCVIGCGAFGTVYRGTWQGLPVAVKKLMFSSSPEGTRSQGVLMEAALSKSISHPNIVATYSCNLEAVPISADTASYGSSGSDFKINAKPHVMSDWRLYIIQEFCSGGSLRNAIEERSLACSPSTHMLPLTRVLDLAAGIAGGMSHLHDRNVIHGDLNPANVLLKSDGTSKWTPKVCDFGFSIHLADTKSHVSNVRRGTPFYIAPEVSQCGKLSKAADVYAMGVLLWELFMGKLVWKTLPTGEAKVRSTFPRLDASAPAALQRLVLDCIHSDAASRPTFSAVVTALANIMTSTLDKAPGSQSSSSACMALPSSMGGTSALPAFNSRRCPAASLAEVVPPADAAPGGAYRTGFSELDFAETTPVTSPSSATAAATATTRLALEAKMMRVLSGSPPPGGPFHTGFSALEFEQAAEEEGESALHRSAVVVSSMFPAAPAGANLPAQAFRTGFSELDLTEGLAHVAAASSTVLSPGGEDGLALDTQRTGLST